VARTQKPGTSPGMKTLTALQQMDNAKALDALVPCVGMEVSGYGRAADGVAFRFSNGVRVVISFADDEAVLDELAGVLSLCGKFTGGVLKELDADCFVIAGIGECELCVP
jgi:hypothetical protein